VRGDHGDRFYIILEGQLEIIKALGTPDEQLLNICGPGDYVGEMCLLDPDRSRTASVRTGSPVRLLEMTRAHLDALLYQYPAVGYAMARVLSQRLRASETKMSAELNRKKSELSQAYSHLLLWHQTDWSSLHRASSHHHPPSISPGYQTQPDDPATRPLG
jgi:CRP-like cAMP-binding protein